MVADGCVVVVVVVVVVAVVVVVGLAVVVVVVVVGAPAADNVAGPRRDTSEIATGVIRPATRMRQTTPMATRCARATRRSRGKRTTQRS